MLNKTNHFSCKNCDKSARVEFNNSVAFCFGLVKKLYKPVDHYRFCICKGKKRNVNDLMEEETMVFLMGLSQILLKKRLEDVNSNKEK